MLILIFAEVLGLYGEFTIITAFARSKPNVSFRPHCFADYDYCRTKLQVLSLCGKSSHLLLVGLLPERAVPSPTCLVQ